ncbi:MAG: alanine--tRNA ligase, partial [Peptostreptococcaceae bacterium]|nr:alanine--tRNA ligase [Peptostreptococcaceae bacterium]
GWAEDESELVFEGNSVFTGYSKVTDTGTVTGIFHNKMSLSSLKEGDIGIVVLNNTPFYAESGGQASDKGFIYNNEFKAEVLEVVKIQKAIGHKVKVQKGQLNINEEVTAMISIVNRNNTARNHTATHLLHKALRHVIGDHVNQAGSSVTAYSLRFDFSHFESIPKDKLKQIEEIVNDKILHFLPVSTEEMSVKEASQKGATALFGEKYGDVVRVVSIDDYSKELCGGTHVNNIGQIGAFKILSEAGVAAGVRRIEAITGLNILKKLDDEEDTINQASEILKTNVSGLLHKIAFLNEDYKSAKKELEEFKLKEISSSKEEIIKEAKEFNGVKLITKSFTEYSINDLRTISDELKSDNKSLVIVFSTENEGKVTFMVSVTDDLFDKGYHAGNMIKQIAAAAGGGGGGKADMAQAGAKDSGKIKDAFKVAEGLMK